MGEENVIFQYETMNEIWTILITAITSGGLGWIFTARWTRKQAEADAMKSVQEVYQEMIDDLRKDRQSLKMKVEELERQVAGLESEVKRNAAALNALKPFLCYVENCPNRKKVADSGAGGTATEGRRKRSDHSTTK